MFMLRICERILRTSNLASASLASASAKDLEAVREQRALSA